MRTEVVSSWEEEEEGSPHLETSSCSRVMRVGWVEWSEGYRFAILRFVFERVSFRGQEKVVVDKHGYGVDPWRWCFCE